MAVGRHSWLKSRCPMTECRSKTCKLRLLHRSPPALPQNCPLPPGRPAWPLTFTSNRSHGSGSHQACHHHALELGRQHRLERR